MSESRSVAASAANLGLSAQQIAARRNWLGGSDAGKIMSGDWLDLWNIKTGRVEPEDLSGVLAVQLGHHTEALNLSWFERETGHAVTSRGAERSHPYYGFMHCTLDGMAAAADAGKGAIVQAKWSNPFSRTEEIEQRYMAQVHHEMLVCGCSLAFLSVITGKPEYHCIEIRRDPDYAATLLQYEEDFWSYVENDTPPPDRAGVAPPAKVTAFRSVKMTGNNAWAIQAGIWRENKDAHGRCERAAKELRALIEADVSDAVGHGVKITRSKDGKLLLRELG